MLLGFTIRQVWMFVAPMIAGAIGALLTRWFRKKDDREARRLEMVASRLQEAYLMVCEAIEHPGMDAQEAFARKLKLEKAINTIDLYADTRTRASARKIAEEFASAQPWVSYEPLLTELRDRFREIMGLERLNDPVVALKFGHLAEGHEAGSPR